MDEYIIKKGTVGYYGSGGFWRFMRYARVKLTATNLYIKPLLVFLPIFKEIVIPLSNIADVEFREQSKWASLKVFFSSQRHCELLRVSLCAQPEASCSGCVVQ
jgi:hypothetical protein